MKFFKDKGYGFLADNTFFHVSGYVGEEDISNGFDPKDIVVLEHSETDKGKMALRWCLSGKYYLWIDPDKGIASHREFEGAVKITVVGSTLDYFKLCT